MSHGQDSIGRASRCFMSAAKRCAFIFQLPVIFACSVGGTDDLPENHKASFRLMFYLGTEPVQTGIDQNKTTAQDAFP